MDPLSSPNPLTAQILALAAALGFASGLRLYAAVFITGVAGSLGWLDLPSGLQVLAHPALLAVSGVMLLAEFFADKVPAFDSLWDAVHTFIRIPAGAALAAGALGSDQLAGLLGLSSSALTWLGVLLGGSLAATSHVAKASTRLAINTSPEPFSNWAASLAEDGLVIGALWLAVQYPGWFALALVVALALMVGLIVLLVKFLKILFKPQGPNPHANAASANP